MLQRAAHQGDSLQLVVAQVQLHQPRHVEGVGRDALVCQLVVGHPHILQLSEAAQEALWQRVNGVGLHVELVQMFRESLRDLGAVVKMAWKGFLHAFNGTFAHRRTLTFVSLLWLTSSSVRDVSAFRDAPMSLTALSLRYRIVRLSIPSRSAAVT